MQRHLSKAFTLLELLTVLVIVGILATVWIPLCRQSTHKIQAQGIQLQLTEYVSALKHYQLYYGRFPDFLEHSVAPVAMQDHIEHLQAALSNKDNPSGPVFMAWNMADYQTLCKKLRALYKNDTLWIAKASYPYTVCIYPAADPNNRASL